MNRIIKYLFFNFDIEIIKDTGYPIKTQPIVVIKEYLKLLIKAFKFSVEKAASKWAKLNV